MGGTDFVSLGDPNVMVLYFPFANLVWLSAMEFDPEVWFF
jgi:hypothetical protein